MESYPVHVVCEPREGLGREQSAAVHNKGGQMGAALSNAVMNDVISSMHMDTSHIVHFPPLIGQLELATYGGPPLSAATTRTVFCHMFCSRRTDTR